MRALKTLRFAEGRHGERSRVDLDPRDDLPDRDLDVRSRQNLSDNSRGQRLDFRGRLVDFDLEQRLAPLDRRSLGKAP